MIFFRPRKSIGLLFYLENSSVYFGGRWTTDRSSPYVFSLLFLSSKAASLGIRTAESLGLRTDFSIVSGLTFFVSAIFLPSTVV